MNPTSLHRRGSSSWTSGVLLLLLACNGRRCGRPDDTAPDCAEADKRPYYLDADGDGFGDALEVTEACVAPDDHVTNSDDCDDGDPARVDMVSLWVDEDGDGFGVGDAVQVCEGAPDYSDQDGDCDDDDGAVYPGAPVVEDNGKDDDCDGLSDADAPTGEQYANQADVRITGSAAGELGYAVYSAGDLNEDGWPDLAVGAPQEDGVGVAYVFYGPLGDGAATVEDAGTALTGSAEDYQAGSAFVADDLTGDGVRDLGTICAGGSARDGGVSLHIVVGPLPEAALLEYAEHDVVLTGSGTTAVDVLDFVGNDGAVDLVGSYTSSEEVLLARGPFTESYPDSDDDHYYGILDADLSADFGTSLSFVGDMTGDGEPDLLVGSPQSSATTPDGEYVLYVGKTYIIDSPLIIRQDDTDDIPWSIYGPERDSYFGEATAPAGDVDGDGYADVWISAPSLDDDSGAVYLFSGSAVVNADYSNGFPFSEAEAVLTGADDGGRFGAKLAGNADANGDGVMDLAVAAPEADDGQGAVYLWYGAIDSGTASGADLILGGEGSGDRFGASVSLRDDMNLLGNVDLVVGAPGANDGDGVAYVFFTDGL